MSIKFIFDVIFIIYKKYNIDIKDIKDPKEDIYFKYNIYQDNLVSSRHTI